MTAIAIRHATFFASFKYLIWYMTLQGLSIIYRFWHGGPHANIGGGIKPEMCLKGVNLSISEEKHGKMFLNMGVGGNGLIGCGNYDFLG